MVEKDQGKPMGRPPVFISPDDLNEKVAEYFEYIKGKLKEGSEFLPEDAQQWDRKPEPATITGLTLWLGFESRQSFYDYEKNPEFSYAIKRARLQIESEYEKKLSYQSPTGAIFALKNMSWKDKSETDITTGGDKINSIQVEVIRNASQSKNESGI